LAFFSLAFSFCMTNLGNMAPQIKMGPKFYNKKKRLFFSFIAIFVCCALFFGSRFKLRSARKFRPPSAARSSAHQADVVNFFIIPECFDMVSESRLRCSFEMNIVPSRAVTFIIRGFFFHIGSMVFFGHAVLFYVEHAVKLLLLLFVAVR
jgi:hypothetical protein